MGGKDKEKSVDGGVMRIKRRNLLCTAKSRLYNRECGYFQNAKTLFLKEGADVILLDVNLPDGEGFDFCEWVKERTPVPVLFLTAKRFKGCAIRAMKQGRGLCDQAFFHENPFEKINVLLQKQFETEQQIVLR